MDRPVSTHATLLAAGTSDDADVKDSGASQAYSRGGYYVDGGFVDAEGVFRPQVLAQQENVKRASFMVF